MAEIRRVGSDKPVITRGMGGTARLTPLSGRLEVNATDDVAISTAVNTPGGATDLALKAAYERTIQPTTYTPALYGNATPWTQGNGTVIGSLVWVHSKAITVSATVTIGTTSVIPAGTMRITLPYPPRAGTGRHHGSATVFTNAWAEYVATVRTAAGLTYVEFLQAPSGFLTDASPRALSATDVLAFSMTYPVD